MEKENNEKENQDGNSVDSNPASQEDTVTEMPTSASDELIPKVPTSRLQDLVSRIPTSVSDDAVPKMPDDSVPKTQTSQLEDLVPRIPISASDDTVQKMPASDDLLPQMQTSEDDDSVLKISTSESNDSVLKRQLSPQPSESDDSVLKNQFQHTAKEFNPELHDLDPETQFNDDGGPKSNEFCPTPHPSEEGTRCSSIPLYNDLSSLQHYKNANGVSTNQGSGTNLSLNTRTENQDLLKSTENCKGPPMQDFSPPHSPELRGHEEPAQETNTEQIQLNECTAGCGSKVPYGDKVGKGMCQTCFLENLREESISDLEANHTNQAIDSTKNTQTNDTNTKDAYNPSTDQTCTDCSNTRHCIGYNNQKTDINAKTHSSKFQTTTDESRTHQSAGYRTTDATKESLMAYNPAAPPTDYCAPTGLTGFYTDPLQLPSTSQASTNPSENRPQVNANQPVKKPKHRCCQCKRKVTFIERQYCVCLCMKLFCPKHIAPEEHGCTFPWKTRGRNQLAKDNPTQERSKVTRMKEPWK